jgi:hypothetical protein
MGLAEHDLHRWLDSEAHLSEALASPDYPWIKKIHAQLAGVLASARRHIGELSVQGTPGAAVYVNEESKGILPLSGPIRLGEGEVKVQITAPRYQPVLKTLTIKGQQTITLTAELESVEPQGPTAPPVPTGADFSLETHRPGWAPQKIWAVSLLGASAAALVAGTAFLVMDNNETCTPPAGGVCPELYDTKLQGRLLLGTGIVAGAVGGYLLYRSSRVAVSIAPAPTGLVAFGRF